MNPNTFNENFASCRTMNDNGSYVAGMASDSELSSSTRGLNSSGPGRPRSSQSRVYHAHPSPRSFAHASSHLSHYSEPGSVMTKQRQQQHLQMNHQQQQQHQQLYSPSRSATVSGSGGVPAGSSGAATSNYAHYLPPSAGSAGMSQASLAQEHQQEFNAIPSYQAQAGPAHHQHQQQQQQHHMARQISGGIASASSSLVQQQQQWNFGKRPSSGGAEMPSSRWRQLPNRPFKHSVSIDPQCYSQAHESQLAAHQHQHQHHLPPISTQYDTTQVAHLNLQEQQHSHGNPLQTQSAQQMVQSIENKAAQMSLYDASSNTQTKNSSSNHLPPNHQLISKIPGQDARLYHQKQDDSSSSSLPYNLDGLHGQASADLGKQLIGYQHSDWPGLANNISIRLNEFAPPAGLETAQTTTKHHDPMQQHSMINPANFDKRYTSSHNRYYQQQQQKLDAIDQHGQGQVDAIVATPSKGELDSPYRITEPTTASNLSGSHQRAIVVDHQQQMSEDMILHNQQQQHQQHHQDQHHQQQQLQNKHLQHHGSASSIYNNQTTSVFGRGSGCVGAGAVSAASRGQLQKQISSGSSSTTAPNNSQPGSLRSSNADICQSVQAATNQRAGSLTQLHQFQHQSSPKRGAAIPFYQQAELQHQHQQQQHLQQTGPGSGPSYLGSSQQEAAGYCDSSQYHPHHHQAAMIAHGSQINAYQQQQQQQQQHQALARGPANECYPVSPPSTSGSLSYHHHQQSDPIQQQQQQYGSSSQIVGPAGKAAGPQQAAPPPHLTPSSSYNSGRPAGEPIPANKMGGVAQATTSANNAANINNAGSMLTQPGTSSLGNRTGRTMAVRAESPSKARQGARDSYASTNTRSECRSSSGLPKSASNLSNLTKKSNSTTQLSTSGTKKRLGFRKKQVTSFSVHRSEEVAPLAARHLVKQGSSMSECENSISGESLIGSVTTNNSKVNVDDLASMSFIDGLGKGQMISRQGLASPYLGDIQLSFCDRRGNLEIEVIRARNLHAKNVKVPYTYVKLYLVKNRKCLAKAKTNLTPKRCLNPLYQSLLTFHEDYKGSILQAIVWGNFSKMDKKNFMGIAQISIDDLDLTETVVCWYKLFLPSSIQAAMPSKSLRSTLLSNSSESFANPCGQSSSNTPTQSVAGTEGRSAPEYSSKSANAAQGNQDELEQVASGSGQAKAGKKSL